MLYSFLAISSYFQIIIYNIGYASKSELQYCSTFYKAYLIFPYNSESLDKQLAFRQQQNEFLKEEELWGFIEMAISGLAFLQEHDICHSDIRPFNIFISQNGLVQIADNELLNSNTSYSQALSGGDTSGIYISPALMDVNNIYFYEYFINQGLKNQFINPIHDPFKSDVFSLGMTIMHAATLQNCDSIYNYQNYQISQQQISFKLQQIGLKYSQSLVSFISEMIQFDENKRLSFIELKTKLDQERVRVEQLEQQKQINQDVQQQQQPSQPNNIVYQSQNVSTSAQQQNKIDIKKKQEYEPNLKFQEEQKQKLEEASIPQQSLPKQYTSQIQYDEINALLRKYGIEPIEPSSYKFSTNFSQTNQVIKSSSPSYSSQQQNYYQQYMQQQNQNLFSSGNSQDIYKQQISVKKEQDIKSEQKQELIEEKKPQQFQTSQFKEEIVQKANYTIQQPLHSSQYQEQIQQQQFGTSNRQEIDELSKKVDEVLAKIKKESQEYYQKYSPSQSQLSKQRSQAYEFQFQQQIPQQQQQKKYINVEQILQEAREHQQQAAKAKEQLQQFSQNKKQQAQQEEQNLIVESEKQVKKAKELLLQKQEQSTEKDYEKQTGYEQYLKEASLQKEQIENKKIQKEEAFEDLNKVEEPEEVQFNLPLKENNIKEVSEEKVYNQPTKVSQQQQQFSSYKKQENQDEEQRQQSPNQQELVIENYSNGSIYQGEKQYGQRHGKGKFYYSDGGVYDGQWVYNKMEGQGILYYGSGKPAYNGSWIDDKFHGQGILYNENPVQFDGTFDFSNFDLVDEFWVKYEGEFEEDNKEGQGILYLSNSEKYEGHFSQDYVHGEGKFYKLDGTVIEGMWEKNHLIQFNQ